MKYRLAEVVDEVVITGQNTDEKMCSCESDVVDETCSSESYGACGDCGSANKAEYLTILEFTHFCEFFSFNYVEENRKEKTLIQKITVAVAFELETGNTKNPDIKVNMDTIE